MESWSGLRNKPGMKKRFYEVTSNVLKPGKNVLQIRVDDTGGGGGLIGAASEVYLQIGDAQLTLAGEWLFAIEEVYQREKSIFSEGKNCTGVVSGKLWTLCEAIGCQFSSSRGSGSGRSDGYDQGAAQCDEI